VARRLAAGTLPQALPEASSGVSPSHPSVVGVDVKAKVEIGRKLELILFWIGKVEAPGAIGEP